MEPLKNEQADTILSVPTVCSLDQDLPSIEVAIKRFEVLVNKTTAKQREGLLKAINKSQRQGRITKTEQRLDVWNNQNFFLRNAPSREKVRSVIKQQKIEKVSRGMRTKKTNDEAVDKQLRVKSMIEKRGLKEQDFLQKTPEMVLMPTVITMPVTYVRHPQQKGGIDEQYLKGCQYLLQEEYIKSFKTLRQCEDSLNFVIKVKNLYLSKAIEQKDRGALDDPKL